MQCVILAGGLGTRMRPVTEQIPKAMMPVHGRPFVDYQLAWLASAGVDEAVMCLGYLGAQLRDFVVDGSRWNIRVSYADEGNSLMGTGGAVRVAFDAGLLRDEFAVVYGDSYLFLDLRDVMQTFHRSGKPALMTVFKNAGKWEPGNVILRDGEIVLYEKHAQMKEMEFVDYGLSMFRRDFIAARCQPGVQIDLATILHELSVRGQLAAYEAGTRFYEVGSATGLADFEEYVMQTLPELVKQ
jgi:NDP-sugar pyrophosphorylase family protein